MGDYFIVPIDKDYVVKNIDGAETYFENEKNENGRQAYLTKFSILNGKLCANFTGFNSYDCTDCFIVFDTQIPKMFEFHSTEEYKRFATMNHLPMPEDFKDFSTNYENYWSKRKNWLLP